MTWFGQAGTLSSHAYQHQPVGCQVRTSIILDQGVATGLAHRVLLPATGTVSRIVLPHRSTWQHRIMKNTNCVAPYPQSPPLSSPAKEKQIQHPTPQCFCNGWIWCSRSLIEAVELQRKFHPNHLSGRTLTVGRKNSEPSGHVSGKKVTLFKNYQTSLSSASLCMSALDTVLRSNPVTITQSDCTLHRVNGALATRFTWINLLSTLMSVWVTGNCFTSPGKKATHFFSLFLFFNIS